MTIFKTILALFVLKVALADELLFVFELSRHGARAPIIEGFENAFSVGPEMLTPSGYRQHFLIGEFLRKKYIDEMKFLSPDYRHQEVHVASTHMARTIQSARAHLMGLYGVKAFNNTPTFEDYSNSLPHLNMSSDYIHDILSHIPYNYDPIAVFNNDVDRDTIYSYGSCPYLKGMYFSRYEDKSNWKSFDDYFEPRIYKKLADVLGVQEELDYIEAYRLSDALIALEFEGVITRENFTNEEWKDIERLQMPWLIHCTTDLGNKLMVSKLFNPVYEMILTHLGKSTNPDLTKSFKGPKKYILYSSHDLLIAAFHKFLKPENMFIEFIPYASNFIFELYKRPDGSSYLKVLYNNQQLKLPFCKEMDCEFDEFHGFYEYTGMKPLEIITLCNLEYS